MKEFLNKKVREEEKILHKWRMNVTASDEFYRQEEIKRQSNYSEDQQRAMMYEEEKLINPNTFADKRYYTDEYLEKWYGDTPTETQCPKRILP